MANSTRSDRTRQGRGATNGHAHTGRNSRAHGGDADPLYTPHQGAAAAIVRRILGRRISDKTRAGLKDDWAALLEFVESSEGLGRDELVGRVRQFIAGLKSRRSPADIKAMTDALEGAWQAAQSQDPGDEPNDGPPPFSLGLVDSATFFGQEYPVEFLIEDFTVKDQTSATGGPSKTLKTSLLVAKIVALGSGTPFLGRFHVPTPRRVALISGESGKQIIQSTARHVCEAHGITTADLANVHWGFTLPMLTSADHLKVLQRTIGDLGLEYIAIDPFYLTMMAGKMGVDAKNMFEMGPVLADVASACLDAGCTPEIAHHFVKGRENPFGAPELNDLAFAGFGQFVAQWMLVAPREPYDAEVGLFKLHLCYGGRAGHSGALAVDIEVGRREGGVDRRCWKVSVNTPSEVRNAQQEQRRAEAEAKRRQKEQEQEIQRTQQEREAMCQAIDLFRKAKGCRLTVGQLRTATGWRKEKADRTVYLLLQSETIRPATVEVPSGKGGRTRETDGYELIGQQEAAA